MVRVQSTYMSVISLIVDLFVMAALALAITLSGCERKEKVLEVNTPNKNVEVTRDKDTGQVDVEVRNK